MCIPTGKKVANIVPSPNAPPEKAPEPVPIRTAPDRKNRGRDSLRIDLAGTANSSGVNV